MSFNGQPPILSQSYFEAEFANIQKPYFERVDRDRIRNILPCFEGPNPQLQLIQELCHSLRRCQDFYSQLKYMLFVHEIISHTKVGKLYFLEVFTSMLTFHPDPKERFAVYLVKAFAQPYLFYLKKICSGGQVYTFCTSSHNSIPKGAELYYWAAVNMFSFPLQFLEETKPLFQILQHTYPFMLDIVSLVTMDAIKIYKKIQILSKLISRNHEKGEQIVADCADRVEKLVRKAQEILEGTFVLNEFWIPDDFRVSIMDTELSVEKAEQFMASPIKSLTSLKSLQSHSTTGQDSRLTLNMKSCDSES